MMRLKNFFLLLLCSLQVFAQSNAKQTARITRQYNDVSFFQALKDLNAHQSKYTINFVYDVIYDNRSSEELYCFTLGLTDFCSFLYFFPVDESFSFGI